MWSGITQTFKKQGIPIQTCSRLNNGSQSYEVLNPGTGKCYLVWGKGLHRYDKLRILWWGLFCIIQMDTKCHHKCLHRKGSEGYSHIHTHTHTQGHRQRQRLEWHSHKQSITEECRHPANVRRSRESGGSSELPTPQYPISSLQNYEMIHICCFKPPRLRSVVCYSRPRKPV